MQVKIFREMWRVTDIVYGFFPYAGENTVLYGVLQIMKMNTLD